MARNLLCTRNFPGLLRGGNIPDGFMLHQVKPITRARDSVHDVQSRHTRFGVPNQMAMRMLGDSDITPSVPQVRAKLLWPLEFIRRAGHDAAPGDNPCTWVQGGTGLTALTSTLSQSPCTFFSKGSFQSGRMSYILSALVPQGFGRSLKVLSKWSSTSGGDAGARPSCRRLPYTLIEE